MRGRAVTTGTGIVQIKVQLREVRPAVWRRIQIPATATMSDLHEVLQEVLGWTDSHLHEFEVDARRIGLPDPDWDDEGDLLDETLVSVGDAVGPGTKLSYVYDFGDDWRHELTVERITPAEPGVRYPRCLAGARACPPEDVGGAGGYEHFLEALRDPGHEDHEMYAEWGGGFDPSDFDPAAADQTLVSLAWKNTVLETGPRADARSRTRATARPALRLVPTVDEAAPAITLRCTAKLLKLLGTRPSDLLDAPPCAQDWYANLLWIDGRKCLLITHAGTLFSLFLPDVRAADLRPIGAALLPPLRAELVREALPADTFGPLADTAPVHLAKTADRSVLGCMNDLALRCEWTIERAGGLARLDLADLHRGLQRNLSGARGYARPIDLVRG